MPDVLTTPRLLEPSHASEVAEMLHWADEQHLAVVARGHGTKARWGVPAGRTDVILSLARLREPIEHCAGDLTVTAPAGASLLEVNEHLAREGQWLPLDPWAGGRSTIGGLLATNDSGPRRLRYGCPRDLIIGIDFALADGRRAKAGGRVVKNVAGYDLGRLLCGSYGSLAVITAATFKLSPLPPASRTVAIDVPASALGALLQAIATAPVTPSAVEIDAPGPRLLVRFETTATAADEQAAHVMGLTVQHGATAALLQGAAETDAWTAYTAAMAQDGGTLLKLSVLPSRVNATLDLVARHATAAGLRWHLAGRATLGVLLAHCDGDSHGVVSLVSALRRSVADASGHVAVLFGPPDVAASVAPWNDVGAAAQVMRAVKAQFDPHGTLCPGGGPGGLA